jgi:hypothetical protein
MKDQIENFSRELEIKEQNENSKTEKCNNQN